MRLILLTLLLVPALVVAQFGAGPRRLNPLQAGLVAAWQFEESTGTRKDVWGTNDLTAVNSPTQATGKLGFAAGFRSAGSQYFTRAASPEMNVSNAVFTFAGWLFISNNAASYFQAWGARSSASPFTNDQWAVDYVAGAGLRHVYGIGASSLSVVTNANAISNSWMLSVVWCDLADSKIGAALFTTNGSNLRTNTRAFPAGRGTTFEVGAGRASSFLSGATDDCAMWNRLLTVGEMEFLWNLGHGGLANYLTPKR